MAGKNSTHLRLHVENAAARDDLARPQRYDLENLLAAFTDATGWQPRNSKPTPHDPTANQFGSSLGEQSKHRQSIRERMQLVDTSPMDGMLDADFQVTPVCSEEAAWNLLEQIDCLISRLEQTEQRLELQEAQLATGVGVSLQKDETELLVSRMHESLHRAAELTGSDSAAIYLLDETTSELKMRACWGLTKAALAEPPRSLRGAMADLEALMGNAVLLENTRLAPEWGCPREDALAGMCVPIGSPTMPHGTLWLWSDHVRDFSTLDIDAAKSAADKVLADLERSVLADEVLRTRGINRQIESASLVQSSRLPSTQPLHLDYEIAGWTFQGGALGGNFHTWTLNKYQQICVSVGDAKACGAAGAIVAANMQAIVETCWNSKHMPHQVLRKVNDLLWDSQDGDWRSSLCYLQIHPESGSTQLAFAGDMSALVVDSRGFRPLSGTATYLSAQPDTVFRNHQLYLEGGELLILATADVLGGIQRGGFTQESLVGMLRSMQDESVTEIVDHLGRMLPMQDSRASEGTDRTLVAIKRRF
ncbi:MAG: SpoIIE family protein phosphatase [Planctomycetales bacterium]|nr:SpoIIE family protein phosphatase [Planctomycetales bacterium]